MPADGGRIKENLRAAQRRESRRFRIPLIPAHADADPRKFRVPRQKPEVARSEVELLVIKRVVGNVHLAILAEIGAVGVDDRRCVVVNARRAPLEKRSNDHDVELLRQRLQLLSRRPGNRLGKIEIFVILNLAEIHRAKELLQAYDLRTPTGGLSNAAFCRPKLASKLSEHRLWTTPIFTRCCDMVRSLPQFSE